MRMMTLGAQEFVRRFLLRILPRGFVRIRSFGFLANRRRANLLPLCQRLLADQPMPPAVATSSLTQLTCFRCPNVSLPCLSAKDSLSFLLGNSRTGAHTLTLPNYPTMPPSTARASAPTAVVYVLTAIHLNPPLTFLNYPHRVASSDLRILSPTSFTTPLNPTLRRTTRESRMQNL
jgi:Putative transposase